jgi:hypothetical protein
MPTWSSRAASDGPDWLPRACGTPTWCCARRSPTRSVWASSLATLLRALGRQRCAALSSPRGRRRTCESSSPPYATTGCMRRSSCWRRQGCVEVRCSVCAGATSTSTVPSWPSCRHSRRWAGRCSSHRRRLSAAGERSISTPRTVGVLKGHRHRQREEQLAAGAAWDSSNDLVFRDVARRSAASGLVLEGVQRARTARRRSAHSAARPAPHVRDIGTEDRSAPEGGVGATWSRHRRHHPRSLLACHAGDRP